MSDIYNREVILEQYFILQETDYFRKCYNTDSVPQYDSIDVYSSIYFDDIPKSLQQDAHTLGGSVTFAI